MLLFYYPSPWIFIWLLFYDVLENISLTWRNDQHDGGRNRAMPGGNPRPSAGCCRPSLLQPDCLIGVLCCPQKLCACKGKSVAHKHWSIKTRNDMLFHTLEWILYKVTTISNEIPKGGQTDWPWQILFLTSLMRGPRPGSLELYGLPSILPCRKSSCWGSFSSNMKNSPMSFSSWVTRIRQSIYLYLVFILFFIAISKTLQKI